MYDIYNILNSLNNSVLPIISIIPRLVTVEEMLYLFQQVEMTKNHLSLCVVQTNSEYCGLVKNVSTSTLLTLTIIYKFPNLFLCI